MPIRLILVLSLFICWGCANEKREASEEPPVSLSGGPLNGTSELKSALEQMLGFQNRLRARVDALQACAPRQRLVTGEAAYWERCLYPTPAGQRADWLLVMDSSDLPTDLRFQRLEEAAALGHPGARARLLDLLRARSDGSDEDLLEITRWERFGALAGNAEDQVRMGCRTWTGRGVPRDSGLAMTWLSMAATAGHPAADAVLLALLNAGVPDADIFDSGDPEAALEPERHAQATAGIGVETLSAADVGARNPIWVSCISEARDSVSEWWALTNAHPIDPTEEQMDAYRDAVDALMASP
jgi:hypothetical protein